MACNPDPHSHQCLPSDSATNVLEGGCGCSPPVLIPTSPSSRSILFPPPLPELPVLSVQERNNPSPSPPPHLELPFSFPGAAPVTYQPFSEPWLYEAAMDVSLSPETVPSFFSTSPDSRGILFPPRIPPPVTPNPLRRRSPRSLEAETATRPHALSARRTRGRRNTRERSWSLQLATAEPSLPNDGLSYEPSRFVSEVPDDLVCAICLGVMNSPLETPCSHVFCRRCIAQALQHRLRCPVDRLKLHWSEMRPLPRILHAILGNLQLRCRFQGCEAVVPLERLASHERACSRAVAHSPAASQEQPSLESD